jgi:oligopeptide/dipeptide ABC transporter ATP-binding protein
MENTTLSDYVLEVENLKTHFFIDEGVVPAVNGVSFKIKRGSFFAIVGESGCGKSVTAYSILRLVKKPGKIVDGKILLKTKDGSRFDISSMNEKSEDLFKIRGGFVSMIFQEPLTALSPLYTIGNQISEGILLHQPVSKKEAEQLSIDMLKKVGIPGAEKRYHQYPHELSGGMRQRAMIAMALVCKPELLIADEPTTALDVTIQAQILKMIKKFQKEMDMSVIFITHDLGVVAQTADEVVVMYLGRAVEQADVRTLLKRPKHPYTKSLLDSLPGTHSRRDRLKSIRGSVPNPSDIPQGCPFHPRCDEMVKGICDIGGVPPLLDIGNGHLCACALVAKD